MYECLNATMEQCVAGSTSLCLSAPSWLLLMLKPQKNPKDFKKKAKHKGLRRDIIGEQGKAVCKCGENLRDVNYGLFPCKDFFIQTWIIQKYFFTCTRIQINIMDTLFNNSLLNNNRNNNQYLRAGRL